MARQTLGARFVRTAKRRWSSFCLADSTGRELTFGRALVASLLLSRAIHRVAPREQHLGLLLPASVGGALANIAASMSGKVPVNLNFTAGRDAMAAAIERCGITTILTSRVFLSKAGVEPAAGMVFLEDLLAQTSATAKLATLALARLLPAFLLERLFTPGGDPNALATVIFSSGSTGVPNGFTGTLWFPIVTGFGVVYHPNPMDAKTIGDLAERYRATLIISTPTFCGSYVRKCQPEQFATLRYAIVGAEKLRDPIAEAFKEKFGIDLLEGYGCTEMSPIVGVNLPGLGANGRPRARRGTIGLPLPGVAAKVVNPVTFDGPLIDQEGLLLLHGPNRMIGYLGEPAATRDALRGDWYVTGDIATIDADGFIRITDRLSRFSKIAGEMVPHMKIEEELQRFLSESHSCIVTAVPDETKGERLVAFYTDPRLTAQQIWERLSATPMPKLWLPKREDLRFIEAIPTLGTGKVDLRSVRALASLLPAGRA